MAFPTGQPEQGDTGMGANPVVFGEVLFDCFPDGRRVLGGAPFNVAWALKGFGFDPLFVSAVGHDEDGRLIRQRMVSWGMRDTGLATHATLPTGNVEVHLENGDARYVIPQPRAWDEITVEGITAESVLYHGMLSLRSEANNVSLKALLDRSRARRFLDVNLRPPHTPVDRVRSWLPGANWVKCNMEELAQILGLSHLSFADCADAAERLRGEFETANVLVTAGGEGACAVGTFGTERFRPSADKRDLVDTVGAGDSFSAVFIAGLLTGQPVAEALRAAGRFARSVCFMRGATTDHPDFYTLTED